MDGTKKGGPIGIDMNVSNVKGGKGGVNGRGERRKNRHAAQGYSGQNGPWGAGQGQQYSELRNGRRSPIVVDTYPVVQAIQDQKRGRWWCYKIIQGMI